MLLRLRTWLRSSWDLLPLAVAALRHDEVPRRAVVALVGAFVYAVSPLDVVPDVVPLAGLVDDVLVAPLAIAVALRAIPDHVVAEIRSDASLRSARRLMLVVVGIVVAVWVAMSMLLVVMVIRSR